MSVGSVSTGSLPVPIVQGLMLRWKVAAAKQRDDEKYWDRVSCELGKPKDFTAVLRASNARKQAVVYEACIEDLRAQVEAVNVRQPKENVGKWDDSI